MAYRFPTRRRAADPIKTGASFDVQDSETKEPGLVQGRIAASINEYNVARALYKLGLDFYYQYPLFGGTSRRGGIVIDFVVFVAPEQIPLEVQSERWHTGQFGSREQLRIAIIEKEMGTAVRMVWEDDTMNESDAVQAVKKAIYDPV